jgi:integrase/recombinase XerD
MIARGVYILYRGYLMVTQWGKSSQPTLMQALAEEMKLRNYSHKTLKAYRSCLRSFIKYFSPRHPRELTNEDIRSYLLYLIEQEKLAASTINQVFNALRFLYVELYKKPFTIHDIPRPLKARKLPVVLSLEEIRNLFDGLGNIKHRTMLMLVYSAGLRVGEVVHLKIADIDSTRKMIHIKGGKGRKDRYSILSDVLIEVLREYWKVYKPKDWLFEGQKEGKAYSVRSAEKVFEDAVRKAGIKKEVSIHSLRHAFATHLLEQGTDIRFIQELLGHSSVRTTEIYTHVSKRAIGNIKSPIEQIVQRKSK